MSYALSHSAGPERSTVLSLSGCLTIRNMVALHKELLEHAKEQRAMRLVIKEVEDLDITFVQLLLALGRYHEIEHKPFEMQLVLSPEHFRQMHLAGITKILNINPS